MAENASQPLSPNGRERLVRWGSGGLVLALGFIGLLIYLGLDSPVIEARTDAPERITVGEPFEITLTIRNTTDDPQTLTSIGIDTALLNQGLVIERMLPNYRTVDEGNRWTEYTFSIARQPVLDPHTELPMRLTLIATREGTYTGTITVWSKNQLQTTYVDLKFEAVAAQ